MDTQEKTNYDKQAIIRELMGDDEDKLFETLENFSEMLMRYNSAIREIRTKFEVLNDDLSLRNSRNPIESISSRVKKPISIAKKLKRMGYPVTVGSIRDNLNDVAGVRVICSFVTPSTRSRKCSQSRTISKSCASRITSKIPSLTDIGVIT